MMLVRAISHTRRSEVYSMNGFQKPRFASGTQTTNSALWHADHERIVAALSYESLKTLVVVVVRRRERGPAIGLRGHILLRGVVVEKQVDVHDRLADLVVVRYTNIPRERRANRFVRHERSEVDE